MANFVKKDQIRPAGACQNMVAMAKSNDAEKHLTYETFGKG